MSGPFHQVRQAAAESAIAQAFSRAADALGGGWSASAVRRIADGRRQSFTDASPAARLRWSMVAVATAALTHLLLRRAMPATVVPALPSLFFGGVAFLAAIVAWQSEAFVRAWHASTFRILLARLLRPSGRWQDRT